MSSVRPAAPLPFQDPARSFAERVADLLGRLTLEEKLALLHQHTPGVPRLGLAPFHTGKEALHGAAWDGTATVFPQAVGLGATWDPELVAEVGDAIGCEVRAQHDERPLVSLVVWAPVVNLLRDPRWGRNEEGYSEDPVLTAELASAFCRGLVGDHYPYLRVVPVLKHFFAYNQEDNRTRVSMGVRARVLHEYELPAFAGPLAAGTAAGVMPSYNLVNGRPAHLAPEINALLRTVARDELLVCSDAWAPSNIVDEQRYAPDHPSAHAWALRAGVDSFTDKDSSSAFTLTSLRAALDQGLIGEGEVDRAARRVLLARLRTGELDPDGGPFARDGEGQLCSKAHATLAQRAAERAVVLLRNEGGLLPFSLSPGERLGVVGPLADSLFHDWYSGTMPSQVTLAAGLKELAVARVDVDEALDLVVLESALDGSRLGEFAVCDWGYGALTLQDAGTRMYLSSKPDGSLAADQGEPNGWVCKEIFFREVATQGTVLLRNQATGLYLAPEAPAGPVEAREGPGRLRLAGREEALPLRWRVVEDGVSRAARLAKEAAAMVVAVGNHPLINGRETQDRPGLELPEAAKRLVSAVAGACRRTAVVIVSSYPYVLGSLASEVPALLWTSHPGQAGGQALAAVLCGAAEPGGRLAQTWYRSDAELPPIGDYDIIKARRTYQYFSGTPLFPFGHGLSYTSFSYSDASLSVREVHGLGDGAIWFRVQVTNTGRSPGSEVVQLYARPPAGLADRPLKRLCGFARVVLAPGEARMVEVEIPLVRLAFFDVRRHRMALDPGEHEVAAGASSTDIRCRVALRVLAEAPAPRRLWGEKLRAADFDDYEGVVLVDESPLFGSAIAPSDGATGWALFRDVDLGAGEVGRGALAQLWARCASAGSPGGLEVRTGGPFSGELIASVELPPAGGPYEWRELSVPVRAGGVEDLYVVLSGGLRLASLRLSASG